MVATIPELVMELARLVVFTYEEKMMGPAINMVLLTKIGMH